MSSDIPEPLTTAHEIERAKRIGTYGKIDRSKQYDGCYSPEALLKSDNHQWKKLRELERTRLRNGIILIVSSAVVARAPEILSWLRGLLR